MSLTMLQSRFRLEGHFRLHDLKMWLLVAMLVFLVGCDVDVFNRSLKKIEGDYALYIGDDQRSFYVMPADGNGGSISGKLSAIGWNHERIIFVDINLPGTLQIVNVQLKTVSRSKTTEPLHPGDYVQGIELKDPEKVWTLLK